MTRTLSTNKLYMSDEQRRIPFPAYAFVLSAVELILLGL